jgi:DNA/RNA endonuclease G (NUC1)
VREISGSGCALSQSCETENTLGERDMRRILALRWTVAFSIGVLATTAGLAYAGCSCGFGPDARTQADKELWLNKRDKAVSIAKHLPWGLPQSRSDGYAFFPLVQRDYVIGYSKELAIPLWTAYLLTRQTLDAREKAKKASADKSRKECFRADPRLSNGETAYCSNYDEPVYDQGHLVPDADMPARPVSALINSYVFSNITPQHCHFNRGVWLLFEGLVRKWAIEKGEVNVISGVVFDRDGDNMPDKLSVAQRIKANKYGAAPAIPTHFYKAVMHKTESGDMQSIAILLPHIDQKMTRQNDKDYLTQHIVTIEKIEEVAGIDLSPNVSSARSSPQAGVDRFLAPALWDVDGGLPSTFDAACR